MTILSRWIAAIAGFILLQEVGVRAVFPQPDVLNFDRGQYSHMRFAPGEAGMASLGHLSFTWASDPDGFSFVHALNLHGFRDIEWAREKPVGSTRVAFIGDSFVEGFSTETENTIPARVRDNADLDVLNLGIGGGDLPTYAQVLRDVLPAFTPDHVVLVLFANDILPTPLDPAWADGTREPERGNPFSPRALHVVGRLQQGAWTPRRWHEPPFEFLPAVPDPRNPWSDGKLAGRLEAFVAPDIARAIRAGRFNPVLVDYLRWFRTQLLRPISIAPQLAALARHTRQAGATLHVAYIPTKNQVSDRYLEAQARFSPADAVASQMGAAYQTHARLLAEACAAAKIAFLDLTPPLRVAERSDGPLYWDYDDHMRSAGYHLAASEIAAWLALNGVGAER